MQQVGVEKEHAPRLHLAVHDLQAAAFPQQVNPRWVSAGLADTNRAMRNPFCFV